MFKRKILTVALTVSMALALVSGAAQAALVVDTGTPAAGAQYGLAFNSAQAYAAEFTLTGNSIINSLQSYFSGDAGIVTFSIFADGGTLPTGAALYSSNLTTTSSAMSWQGVSSLNWALNAGDYWVAFTPSYANSSMAEVQSSAPSPLAVYAQFQNSNWVEPSEALAIGVRIDATVSAVPELTSITMYALGFAGLAAVARRKKS